MKTYCWNVINVDWGLVVKLALPGTVTGRAYDRFLTNLQFHHKLEFDNSHLKLFYYIKKANKTQIIRNSPDDEVNLSVQFFCSSH
jgi:hypothetical protein